MQKLLEQLHVVWDAQSQALLRNSLKAYKKMNLKYDVNEEIRVGDLVLLKKGTAVDNLKTHPKAVEVCDGPFRVLGLLKGGRVRLGDLGVRRIREVVDEKRLTRYYQRPTDEEFERGQHKLERRWAVEALVGHRVRGGDIEYAVRWLGFDRQYDKYMARDQLQDVWELVRAYERRHDLGSWALKSLERESREVPDELPPVDEQARRRPHFRPTDPQRRREQRAREARGEAEATAAAGAEASTPEPVAAEPEPEPEQAAAATTDADERERSTQAREDEAQQRIERREEARRAQLEAAQRRREEQAAKRRARQAAEGEAPLALLGETMEGDVQLQAATGAPVTISKKVACMAGTLKAMLMGVSKVEGADETLIGLPEIEEHHLARAVEYMHFKLAKQGGATRLFAVDGEQAVALFRVANYLDL